MRRRSSLRSTLPGMSSPAQNPSAAGPPRGQFTIVFLIHEAFRRDLGRLSVAVQAPGVDSARARQLGAHWDFVEDQLHHHHRVEDESLWPLVRPKLAGRSEALAVLDDMEAQHRSLSPENQAIDEGFASFCANPGDAAGTDLSKSALKKIEKDWEAKEKAFAAAAAKPEATQASIDSLKKQIGDLEAELARSVQVRT